MPMSVKNTMSRAAESIVSRTPARDRAERHVAVRALAYGLGQVVRLRSDGEHVDFETVARQIADEAEHRPADRVRMEVSRNETMRSAARGKLPARAFSVLAG